MPKTIDDRQPPLPIDGGRTVVVSSWKRVWALGTQVDTARLCVAARAISGTLYGHTPHSAR